MVGGWWGEWWEGGGRVVGGFEVGESKCVREFFENSESSHHF